MEAIGFEKFDGIAWRGSTTSLCSWVREGDSTMAGDSSRVIEVAFPTIGWETPYWYASFWTTVSRLDLSYCKSSRLASVVAIVLFPDPARPCNQKREDWNP